MVGTDTRVDVIRRGARKNNGIMFVPKSSRGARSYRSGATPSIARFVGRREAASFGSIDVYRMDIRNEAPYGHRTATA